MADVEIMARVERRRKWTAEEKAALLAEVEAEGGKVSMVARRHRISESVLYNWRAAWKAAAAARQVTGSGAVHSAGRIWRIEPSRYSNAGAVAAATAGATAAYSGSDSGVGGIEIVLPNGARVSVDAFVNEKALSRSCAR